LPLLLLWGERTDVSLGTVVTQETQIPESPEEAPFLIDAVWETKEA